MHLNASEAHSLTLHQRGPIVFILSADDTSPRRFDGDGQKSSANERHRPMELEMRGRMNDAILSFLDGRVYLCLP